MITGGVTAAKGFKAAGCAAGIKKNGKDDMAMIFTAIASDYSQTCSKLEQLTLAMFMETGAYQTHLRKLRKLYSQKLNAVTKYFSANAADFIEMRNSRSGINLLIRLATDKPAETIKKDAAKVGIPVTPLQARNLYLLYYNQIPLGQIPEALEALTDAWRGAS